MAVLYTADANEAWQLLRLHGVSVELAIIHREGMNGKGEDGLKLVEKIKRDSAQADLPYIITSDVWADPEFADHQRGPLGANAYLHWPCDLGQLLGLIEAVTEQKLGVTQEASGGTIAAPAEMIPAPPSEAPVFNLEGQAGQADSGVIDIDKSASALRWVPDPASITPVDGDPFSLSNIESPAKAASAGAPESPAYMPKFRGDEPPTPPSVSPLAPEQGFPTNATEGGFPTPSIEAAPVVQKPVEEHDVQSMEEMPYLYKTGSKSLKPESPALALLQAVGDAVVPGGAAQSPDIETLKKYLLLREQDVAALSTQLQSTREQVHALEQSLHDERAKNAELAHVTEEQQQKIDGFSKEKSAAIETLEAEITDLRFQIKAKMDKARLLESQVREAAEEMEKLKERVRSDIRKIRVREKELENRLEIMKKDSEALISAREGKIIELKRKIDLLEFNMDLLQDQYMREKETSAKLRERLGKAAQAMRAVGGLLDQPASGAGSPGSEDPGSREAS